MGLGWGTILNVFEVNVFPLFSLSVVCFPFPSVPLYCEMMIGEGQSTLPFKLQISLSVNKNDYVKILYGEVAFKKE